MCASSIRNTSAVGLLWEGRYKSSLIQDEFYLMEVYRYIELTPLRVDLVEDAGEIINGQVIVSMS